MIIKEIEFNQEKLMSGIKKISDAVSSTLGPMGRTVLIESENHTRGITVTKDGVTVAKSIILEDPIENLAVTMIKEASEKTATAAGDGTTTSVVLASAIIDAFITEDAPNNPQILRDIVIESKKVIKELEEMAIPVTNEMLLDVATISANNDKEIGSIVHDAYTKVGRDGIVTVENSSTSITYSEVVDGMRVQRGYSSKYMINEQKKQEIILNNPYILISDQEIASLHQIEHILAEVIRQNRSILIIAEISENAMYSLNMNSAKKVLKVGTIVPPQFGYKRDEIMNDLAFATGGLFISDSIGDNMELMTIDSLGEADKVIIGKDSTVIMLKDGDAAKQRIDDIKEITASTKEEIDFRNERIANLSGGIAVIYVGASSDIEQKEKRDRVDDAVCATRAALEEGILPGGGYALLHLSADYDMMDGIVPRIMTHALSAPCYQIMANAGLSPEEIEDTIEGYLRDGIAYNVKTGELGKMIEMGIVDPLKVTKSALENAVSVSTTLLGTQCIIYNVRQK